MTTIKLNGFEIQSQNWRFNNTKETPDKAKSFTLEFLGSRTEAPCHPRSEIRPADSIVVFDTPNINGLPNTPELYFLKDVENLEELEAAMPWN